METTMTLEKYKSMKKAKNVREEKKLKNIDIDALIKKKSKKSSSNVRSEFRNNYKNEKISILSNSVIQANLRKFILIFPLNCCIIHWNDSIGVSPRGKAQDFDSCITMVRIHLPQPRENALTLFVSAFFRQ